MLVPTVPVAMIKPGADFVESIGIQRAVGYHKTNFCVKCKEHPAS